MYGELGIIRSKVVFFHLHEHGKYIRSNQNIAKSLIHPSIYSFILLVSQNSPTLAPSQPSVTIIGIEMW